MTYPLNDVKSIYMLNKTNYIENNHREFLMSAWNPRMLVLYKPLTDIPGNEIIIVEQVG